MVCERPRILNWPLSEFRGTARSFSSCISDSIGKKFRTRINLSEALILTDTDIFEKLVSMFCVSRKENLQWSGCTNAERAHCVNWFPQGYDATDFQGLLQETYLKITAARCTIWQGRENYQERGCHNNKGVNGRPWISTAMRNQIRSLFIKDLKISLLARAARTRVCSLIIRNVAR